MYSIFLCQWNSKRHNVSVAHWNGMLTLYRMNKLLQTCHRHVYMGHIYSHWLLRITPRNISIAVSANTKENSHQFVGCNSCKYHLKIQLQLKIKYMTFWNVSKSYQNYCWLLWNENEINSCWGYIAPLEEQCHNSKNAYFELCPQEVCLRLYLPSGIASHTYFLKWPREGRHVIVLLMRFHRPGQWFFPLSWKVVFFELWHCSSRGCDLWC
jgi:hypothetical protein